MITSGISARAAQSHMKAVKAMSFAFRALERSTGRAAAAAITEAAPSWASVRLQRRYRARDVAVAAGEDLLRAADEEARHHGHQERDRHEDQGERHQRGAVDVARRLA